jgi:hypothetical protein
MTEYLKHPDRPELRVTVPYHNPDLKRRTLKSIIEQAGYSLFRRATSAANMRKVVDGKGRGLPSTAQLARLGRPLGGRSPLFGCRTQEQVVVKEGGFFRKRSADSTLSRPI